MTNDCQPIHNCIACGGSKLFPVFDLGEQPLANSYKLREKDDELFFPLAINACEECFHIQLTHIINPDLIYKNYSYMSGVSKTGLDFFKWFADMSLTMFDSKPKSILDIGCNDGSQLGFYKELGLETWGVDPAENLHKITSQKHNVICDYFKAGLIDKTFDMVTVQNAFAHNYDQIGLLNSIKQNLKDDGLLFIATSQGDMIFNGEFDTIYHEHISFYNINSMDKLCKRAGLNLIDVRRHPIHGNSYIFVISKTKTNTEHINQLIEHERSLGLYSKELMIKFKEKAIETVEKLRAHVESYEKMGITVVGYAAPAKGNTFLNYAKIKPKFIIDDTPLKQNKYTPGMSVPISGGHNMFDEIDRQAQVCFIVLAWNFYDEIKTKIIRHRKFFTNSIDKTDIFIRCFPEFKAETVEITDIGILKN